MPQDTRRSQKSLARKTRRLERAAGFSFDLIDGPMQYTIVSREPPRATWAAVLQASKGAICLLLAAYGLVLLWMVYSAPRFTLLDPGSTAFDYALGAIWSFRGYLAVVLIIGFLVTVLMTAHQALYWPLRVYLNRERLPMDADSYDLMARYGTLVALAALMIGIWLFSGLFERLLS